MKKEELVALGLTDDQITKVFEINGKDVNAAKSAAKESVKATMQADIDELSSQLNTAQESLKKFDGVDPVKLTEKITELNAQLASQKADYEKKIADRDFNDRLSSAITSAGGKNAKAISALLDLESLKSSKNQNEDIQAAIENVKKEADYLFTSDEPVKNPVAGTGNGAASGFHIDAAKVETARKVMGLPPKKENE